MHLHGNSSIIKKFLKKLFIVEKKNYKLKTYIIDYHRHVQVCRYDGMYLYYVYYEKPIIIRKIIIKASPNQVSGAAAAWLKTRCNTSVVYYI